MNNKDLAVQKLMQDYTEKRPVIVEDEPDAHTVWLVVNQQSFCVSPDFCETAEDADWLRLMLAKALNTIIENGIKS